MLKILMLITFSSSLWAFSPCGADNRTLTQDPRIGRNLIIGESKKGCTAFLIGKSCMLTAAHCVKKTVHVEFNTPMSTNRGRIQHSKPEDQYTVDQNTIVSGEYIAGNYYRNDFAVFKVLKNEKTDLFPGEVQGKFELNYDDFKLEDMITIRGHGYRHSRVPSEFNVQKSDTGPIKHISGVRVYYNAYTSNGNSGSPIIHERTGKVIGIHTNGGGCYDSRGGNHGYLFKGNQPLIKAIRDCLESQ